MSRRAGIVKTYLSTDCISAARERIRWLFATFKHVYLSLSGGKDSTLLFWLAYTEARRLGRELHVFFLDQEAEYQGTIDVIRILMHQPGVVMHWYQVPLRMTNATSYAEDMLTAWGPGEEWMREKEPDSIHSIDEVYPDRFYPFFDWWEQRQPGGSVFLVGLRAEEGINRFRAVTSFPGVDGVPWTTRTKVNGSFKAYPIYDAGMGDVWATLHENGWPYNRIYDLRYAMGGGIYGDNRVSYLLHEMSFRALADLSKLEPDTYARLLRRIGGVHCAARHANSPLIYDVRELPPGFSTWLELRDHLLATMPIADEKRDRFVKRWGGQGDDEAVHHAQCKQLLIADWENNVPVVTSRARAKRGDRFARWRKLF